MKVAIIGKTHHTPTLERTEELIRLLHRRQINACVEESVYLSLTGGQRETPDGFGGFFREDCFDADMVISLGGDGTFLRSAALVADKGIPIVGINTGRLGFLADTPVEEMEAAVDDIHQGRYRIEERSVLQVSGFACSGVSPYALNEVSILKHDSSSMIAIHTHIDGVYLNTYQADGLIVATPTGSTGYSLSVGGPIIAPQSHSMVITPVAPHSLSCRPLVVRDDGEVTLQVESRSHNFLVAVDGKSGSCAEQTRISISRAPHTIKVVRRDNRTFFNTLRNKMMWGVDVR